MLRLLVEAARIYPPKPEPGFLPRTVRWAIVFPRSCDGVAVFALGGPQESGPSGQTFPRCPDPRVQVPGIAYTAFLVATAEVVALFGEGAGTSRNSEKHRYFVKLLRVASGAMSSLARIADCLDNPELMGTLQERLTQQGAEPEDLVTVSLGDRLPLTCDDWHDWWRSFCESER